MFETILVVIVSTLLAVLWILVICSPILAFIGLYYFLKAMDKKYDGGVLDRRLW